MYKADIEADRKSIAVPQGFVVQSGPNLSDWAAVKMRAGRVGGASAMGERNRASGTRDDQYRWNDFLSVAISSCPSSVQSSATESTSDVGQDSKTSWRI